MSYAYTTVRQQFLIPPTPSVLLDGYIGMQSDGTQYASNTWTDGDSYYTRFWVTGGPGTINFRFTIWLDQLIEDADYYVIDADLTSIAGELVITVTQFIALIPVLSWRFRLNLVQYPYKKITIAPLSTEADITQVSFTESPYWISVIFGVEGRGREYFFVKLSSMAFPRPSYDFLNLAIPYNFPVPPWLKQPGSSYP